MEMLALSKLTEAVVSQTVQRISDLLILEAASLRSVKNDVESLRDELGRMQIFLKRADRKQEPDEFVRNLVDEIRDVASDIEDVIETFILKVDSSYVKAFHSRRLRKEIDSIKTRMEGIFGSKDRYDIELVSGSGESGASLVDERQRNLRRSYPDDDEEEEGVVASLENNMMLLKTKLMEEDDRLCVFPIVGMGGIGKTTLAKKVYNNSDVKRCFDCYAWVFISQQYIPRDVLSEILIQVGFFQSQSTRIDSEKKKHKVETLEERKKEKEMLRTLGEFELMDLIKAELKEKRYLVVLDDIWREDDWDSIRKIFPKGKRGSKVVFTTRIQDVAANADPSEITTIKPPFLESEESWELLHRKAFPRDVFGERGCPPEFERMGRQMVQKCAGLPLAIVVLGGLLRTKNSYDEWKKVQRDVNSYLNERKYRHQYGVKEILALSYHDLPHYLKPCFLYLGCFPRDMEIPRTKLIQLWIAESLVIGSTRRQTVEEIAEQYLRELIDRCMIQVGKRDYTGDGVRTCHMHDLMRDFCVSKAREDNFFEVIQQQEEHMAITSSFSGHPSSKTRTRRIAIHPGCNYETSQMHPRLRSLMCFDVSPLDHLLHLKSKNFMLLRLLEFEFTQGTRHCKVPKEIGDLIHLRYLGMRNGGRVKLPRTIGNLRSLRTISLRDNEEVLLPAEILRLTRLKHLLLPFDTCFPHRFSWLRSFSLSNNPIRLQTLKYIGFGPFLVRRKRAGFELINLRNLGIQFKSSEEVRSVIVSPSFELTMLQSLHMSLLSSDSFPNLQPLSECHILSKLFLDGRILDDIQSGLHSLGFLPTSLTKLILRDSGIREDPMEVLEKLPNLRFLRLHNSYSGSEMVCHAQGFPRLETLQLFKLEKVMEWQVHPGLTMPNLKRLHIKHMPELRMIPDALRHIITLKELKISEMRRSFEDRLRVKDGVEGADFGKVRHVSSISFSWTLPSL